MKKISLLIFAAIILATGCQKSGRNGRELNKKADEYVAVAIIGMIPTSTVYLVKEGEIEKDSMVTQIGNIPNGLHGRKLSEADYQKGKYIFYNLPEQAFSDNNEVYGCPNCADGGAINFIIWKNGKEKKLSLEWSSDNYPDYLKIYMVDVKKILLEI